MAAHLEDDDRDGEREADPEPPRHVDELGVRPGLGGRRRRLERHAADRAGARPGLTDLRVHRAGVDRRRPARFGRLRRRGATYSLRIGDELCRGSRRSRSSRSRPACSALCFAVAGSTVMPHTGILGLPEPMLVAPWLCSPPCVRIATVRSRRAGVLRLGADETLPVGEELLAAAGAAEIVRSAFEFRRCAASRSPDRRVMPQTGSFANSGALLSARSRCAFGVDRFIGHGACS